MPAGSRGNLLDRVALRAPEHLDHERLLSLNAAAATGAHVRPSDTKPGMGRRFEEIAAGREATAA
jgi:hypothetical protein